MCNLWLFIEMWFTVSFYFPVLMTVFKIAIGIFFMTSCRAWNESTEINLSLTHHNRFFTDCNSFFPHNNFLLFSVLSMILNFHIQNEGASKVVKMLPLWAYLKTFLEIDVDCCVSCVSISEIIRVTHLSFTWTISQRMRILSSLNERKLVWYKKIL